ncbi:DUF1638 domain-containing protein [Paracoccus spongiarum]|uniref:DUF1638 domain-containing protein n=1 Tax=Paracoccus spongiarum TaxID=3064387 RepID=A0ABT9JEY8_9RHOB|nr:DUF1638 domain-containing protein [Paracoccus sp. 2205BS29-5]MDP5308378.1 DUF1638 domain-containing protein [Paracoccus sp. 2205BS29-5]
MTTGARPLDPPPPRDLGPPRCLWLACGALARELLAIRDANGWRHVDLHCLPADLHLRPERIPDAVEAAVRRHRGGYDRIIVVYADCGTGGLLKACCDRLGVQMIPGPHCYAFFDGIEPHAARAETEFTAFYLTDFLVRQFDAFVWQAMGLDRHPQLRDAYFAHYRQLIYLAQTEDPALDAKAEAAARRLGLAYQRRATGYGDLPGILSQLSSSASQ